MLATTVDGAAARSYLPYLVLSLRLAGLRDMARRLVVDCLDDEAHAVCLRHHPRPQLCLRNVSRDETIV